MGIKKIWSPKTNKFKIYNIRLNFITSLITIVGLFITIIALLIALFGYLNASKNLKIAFNNFSTSQEQLKMQISELNSKAKIKLKFVSASSTIEIGPEISSPTTIFVNAYNKGNYNTATWAASVIFCNRVKVVEFPKSWKKINDSTYIYQSDKKLLMEMEKAFYHNSLDSIGEFTITIPGKNYFSNLEIPVAFLSSYGEKTEQINIFSRLVSENNDFNKIDFEYEDFLVDDGEIVTNVDGCFEVE